MRRGCGVWCSSVGLLLTWVHLSHAASPGGVHIDTSRCPQLQPEEVRRILLLELEAEDTTQAESISLVAGCEDSEVTLQLTDVSNGTVLTRSIPAPRLADPDKERVVALAASQLAIALGWVQPQPAAPPKPPSPIPPPPPGPERPPSTSSSTLLELGAGPRWRSIGSPFLVGHADLFLSLQLSDPAWVVFSAAAEAGEESRSLGDVRSRAYSAGLGTRFDIVRMKRLRFGVNLHARGTHVQLEGLPDAEATAHGLRGWLMEVHASAGPRLRFGRTELGVELGAGFTAPNLAAQVEGDEPVRFGGAWLAGGLTVGYLMNGE